MKTSILSMRAAWVSKGNAIAVAMLLTLTGMLSEPSQAALGISPPQLVPDAAGIVVTEVQSSMTSASRWSVRLVGWGPAGEEIVGVPGDVSPRFFGLAPGGRQMIRARIKDPSRYHRLLIEQVPEAESEVLGLAFRFRFSLPVYHHRLEPIAHTPAISLAAGRCTRFTNPERRVVRLTLAANVVGPQTLLPGEATDLCHKDRGAPEETLALPPQENPTVQFSADSSPRQP
jgi:hypothetical protein